VGDSREIRSYLGYLILFRSGLLIDAFVCGDQRKTGQPGGDKFYHVCVPGNILPQKLHAINIVLEIFIIIFLGYL